MDSSIKQALDNQSIKKIVLGAGDDRFDGWVSTDIHNFDIRNSNLWQYYFHKDTISNILAEHVFEHLNFSELCHVLMLCRSYMKTGANLRIAVPDANHPSKYVYNLTKPGGMEPGADDHKIFFDIEIANRVSKMFKFDLDLIEYFDEDGIFHYKENDWSKGFVSRSYKNYSGRFTVGGRHFSQPELDKFYSSIPLKNIEQIKNLNITYTSLIFDLIKR